MKQTIIADLSAHLEPSVVLDLIQSYEELIAKHRSGELETALTKAGRFVEHTLRAIEYVRTRTLPAEIKSVQQTILRLESQTALPESLRLLIPRTLSGMIYNLRSKRNAVHVKEIDPTQIDVALAVAAASWVVAELLRQYHKSDEKAVTQAMTALTRTALPFIESVGGEMFVGQKVPAIWETLILLANAKPDGMSRRAIGASAKCSPSSVTNSLKALVIDRRAHRSANDEYFITSAGEQALANWLNELQRP